MPSRSAPFIVATLAVYGCADSLPPASPDPADPKAAQTVPEAVSAVSEQAGDDSRYQYDDPRLSDDQRRAVRAAVQAIERPPRLGSFTASKFRYDVKKTDEGWWVTEWRVHSFDEHGSPRFMPGGFTSVTLDADFVVMDVIPGH